MQIVLIIIIVILIMILMISAYFNYKHAMIILKMIDEVEDSIEVLDSKYKSISEILEIPLFYDSPQIRQVHKDINECRDSVLRVASMLGSIEDEDEDETGLQE